MVIAMRRLTTLALGETPAAATIKEIDSINELEGAMEKSHADLAEALSSADLAKMIALPRGPKGPFEAPAGVLLLQAVGLHVPSCGHGVPNRLPHRRRAVVQHLRYAAGSRSNAHSFSGSSPADSGASSETKTSRKKWMCVNSSAIDGLLSIALTSSPPCGRVRSKLSRMVLFRSQESSRTSRRSWFGIFGVCQQCCLGSEFALDQQMRRQANCSDRQGRSGSQAPSANAPGIWQAFRTYAITLSPWRLANPLENRDGEKPELAAMLLTVIGSKRCSSTKATAVRCASASAIASALPSAARNAPARPRTRMRIL